MQAGNPHGPYQTKARNRTEPAIKTFTLAAAVAVLCATTSVALGFVPVDRWTSTATNASAGSNGDSITVTWGITPDSTFISAVGESSNLVSFLDGVYGTAPGPVSNQPWFSLFEDSFDRWSELGGIRFQYEPADDGATQGGGSPGQLHIRPDVRIGGSAIDGNSGTLAFANFPNGGDIVIDTSDNYFNNTSSNSRRLRNTVMHEVGHTFGVTHIESNNASFLMEPFITTAFDGPQYDDIRGIQHLYGDAFEKTNNGAGNQTSALATDLGLVTNGLTRTIGADTGFGTSISPSQTDFVSIANAGDADFYSFQIDEPSIIDLTLTPVGATFNQVIQGGGAQTTFTTSQISNLSLTLIDSNGFAILSASNANPAGGTETILDFELTAPGEYFVRITGDADTVQFYELDIFVNRADITQPVLLGDYNGDDVVDAADYTVWRDTLGQTGADLAADGNENNIVDAGDYGVWKTHFGEVAENSGALGVASVPEPGTGVLLVGTAMGMMLRRYTSATSRPLVKI